MPGVMHQPAEARNAPTKNVPSCAVIPAAPARPLTTVTNFRLSLFALPASVVRILLQSCNYILSVIVPELVPDACIHGHLIQIRHLHNQGYSGVAAPRSHFETDAKVTPQSFRQLLLRLGILFSQPAYICWK